MSHSKIYFLILNLALGITSISIASDRDRVQYRYLTPLSTNLKIEDPGYSEKEELNVQKDSIYKGRKDSDKEKKDREFTLNFSKSTLERIRESKWMMKKIEREILKRSLEQENELKKALAEIDRERRKYIVEREREERERMVEMEREYRRHLKEMEKE